MAMGKTNTPCFCISFFGGDQTQSISFNRVWRSLLGSSVKGFGETFFQPMVNWWFGVGGLDC